MESEGTKLFEDILDGIGHMGPAQILIMIFSYAIEANAGLSSDYFVIESGNPGFTCTPVTNSTVGNASWNTCPTEETDCVNVTFSGEYTSPVTEVSELINPQTSASVCCFCLLHIQLLLSQSQKKNKEILSR